MRDFSARRAIGYAMHYSRSHSAVIRGYDVDGNMIETHEHARAISKSGEVHFFVALPNERKTSTNAGTLAPALSMNSLVS